MYAKMFWTFLLFNIILKIYVNADDNNQTVLEQFATESNRFGIEVYQELAKKDGNLVFSPLSLQIVLAMIYNGAGGKTATELATKLHYTNQEQLNEAVHTVHKQLNQSQLDLKIANKAYFDNTCIPIQTYLNTIETDYSCKIEQISFSNSQLAIDTINSWADNYTNHKITELVTSNDIDSSTRIVLLNAIYFLGKWAIPFENSTHPIKFHQNNNEIVDVPMISNLFYTNYTFHAQLNAHIVAVQYSDPNYQFLLFVPKEIDGLVQLETALGDIQIDTVVNELKPKEIVLEMPKFKVEQKVEYNQVLPKLGIADMFEQTANLTAMSEELGLYVSKVLQKAIIEVNEEGTEAAVVTAGIISNRIGGTYPLRIVVDRPFVYAIYEQSTKTLLFMGRIVTFTTN